MSGSVSHRTSSYSVRGVSGVSALSLSGGMQAVGSGRGRAPSVYGGAGGYGTRISQSVHSSGPLLAPGETAVITNEKLTMQNLNDRLSSYLQKVRTLEGANRKLELQIREYYESKAAPVASDFTQHFNTIGELRAQIIRRHAMNQRTILQIDNATLALDDFRMKYENELNMRMSVEADVSRLRGVRDSFTVAIGDLKLQIKGLEEELTVLMVNHKEDMQAMKVQQTGAVNVEVDSAESVDLTLVLQEVREQYENVMRKNKTELEKWFQTKVDTLQTQIVTNKTEVTTSHTELSEVKKTFRSSEIKLQSHLSEVQYLERNLEDVNGRCAARLQKLQATVHTLEVELQELRASMEQQQTQYGLLLDIKMRLELEIAEYRRLLEGESAEKQTVVISKVVEEVVQEHKPLVERRVKVITEELVDGVVVSSTSDTVVEEVQ